LVEKQLSDFLDSLLGNESFKPGLDRIRPAFSPIIKELKSRGTKVVIIAGTNGKGETAMNLSHLLQENRYKTALWTSPHVLSVTERYFFNGKNVEADELLNHFNKLKDEINEFSFSYYEFLFYAFCTLAKQINDLDVLILEVGLGGKFDAVNLFEPDITAITSISRDHEEILGPGLKNILKEKLGVCRKSVPLISSVEQSFLRDHISKFSKDLELPWFDWHQLNKVDEKTNFVSQNRFLAFSLFRFLDGATGLELDQLKLQDIENIEFPPLKGRFEKMTIGDNSFIFIGAHNLDGLRKLRDLLIGKQNVLTEKHLTIPFDEIIFSFSKRSEEEIDQSLNLFAEAPCLAKEMKITYFDHFKSLSSEELLNSYNKKRNHFSWIDNLSDYLSKNKSNGRKTILFTGSYYFIGEVQKILRNL